jgi:alkanesulfonate monooxygenase SsuD/methylene tetrahydromethanopterin reductase-like flavin-dependent oxidoreductase (luciferase family)
MNADWYGVEMEHPAPRLEELITLLRLLWAHESGPFDFSGRFYNLKFAHLDKAATAKVDIYSAGVNERMVRVAGRGADGFVGHPIATCDYLNQIATPAINLGLSESDRPPGSVRIATQVITAVHPDRAEARRRAALQVAFYSTVKTYEVIFALHGYGDERQAIRTAFIAGDTEGMLQNTSDRMLQEMAVFGTAEEVMDQLQRYDSVADEIMLYPPHYGLNSEESLSTQVEILDMLAKYPS